MRFVVGLLVGVLPVEGAGGDLGVDVVRRRGGRRVAVKGMREAKAHGDVGLGRCRAKAAEVLESGT